MENKTKFVSTYTHYEQPSENVQPAPAWRKTVYKDMHGNIKKIVPASEIKPSKKQK